MRTFPFHFVKYEYPCLLVAYMVVDGAIFMNHSMCLCIVFICFYSEFFGVVGLKEAIMYPITATVERQDSKKATSEEDCQCKLRRRDTVHAALPTVIIVLPFTTPVKLYFAII
jgi:hypothetical protein